MIQSCRGDQISVIHLISFGCEILEDFQGHLVVNSPCNSQKSAKFLRIVDIVNGKYLMIYVKEMKARGEERSILLATDHGEALQVKVITTLQLALIRPGYNCTEKAPPRSSSSRKIDV